MFDHIRNVTNTINYDVLIRIVGIICYAYYFECITGLGILIKDRYELVIQTVTYTQYIFINIMNKTLSAIWIIYQVSGAVCIGCSNEQTLWY